MTAREPIATSPRNRHPVIVSGAKSSVTTTQCQSVGAVAEFGEPYGLLFGQVSESVHIVSQIIANIVLSPRISKLRAHSVSFSRGVDCDARSADDFFGSAVAERFYGVAPRAVDCDTPRCVDELPLPADAYRCQRVAELESAVVQRGDDEPFGIAVAPATDRTRRAAAVLRSCGRVSVRNAAVRQARTVPVGASAADARCR